MLIQLTDEWVERPKAMAVPGAFYSTEHRAYILEDPTPRGAAVALKLFPNLGISHPELHDLRASLSQDVRPFDNATTYGTPIKSERVRAALAAQDKSFYRFQEIDLGYAEAILNKHAGFYLGWERGLGKTLAVLALIDEFDAKRTLVICPNTAKRSVWEAEIRAFCPWLEVIVLRNTKSQRLKDLGYMQQLIKAGMPFVFIVHYEALNIIRSLRAGGRGWRLFPEWDLVAADEAHRFANPDTKMSRALKVIPAQLKVPASGTIIGNHAEDLFSPLNWLFPEHYSSKWRDWNDRFLDYVDSGYSRVCVGVKIEKLAELRKELGVFMVYRRKEDELDLPDRTEETRFVDLSPAQEKVYRELQETCLSVLDNGEMVKAQDGLVLLTRLRQVATGLDLISGGVSDSTKLDLAVELITDNPDEAFVVFSWYKAAAYSLADRLTRLGIGNYVITGDTKHDDRAQYIQEFQAGEGRVFIGTLSTLGESVTLHRASNAVFLDRSWNPGVNAQAADRIYRIGQSRPVTITYIVAKDTVDELRVLPVVQDKDALRRLILGG